ncbi:MAG: hypothetical protein LBE55_01485 [Clostridiales bacterium]|jgi:hypothetical protein|nr:hypothetical protein [Clostridiales bacterium]
MKKKMKKWQLALIVSLSAILSIILLLSLGIFQINIAIGAPGRITRNWQTVYVEGGTVGRLSVPAEWYVEWDDDVVYMTDRPREEGDYTLYAVGTIHSWEGGNRQPHELLNGVEKGDLLSLRTYSAGGRISLYEFEIGEEIMERYSILVWNLRDPRFTLLIWDDGIDNHIADQIARTVLLGR